MMIPIVTPIVIYLQIQSSIGFLISKLTRFPIWISFGFRILISFRFQN